MTLGGKRLRREGSAQQAVSPAEERTRLATVEAEKRSSGDGSVGAKEVLSGVVSFTGGVSRKIAQAAKKPQEPRPALGIHGEDEE